MGLPGWRVERAETAMLEYLFLGATLSLGQTPPACAEAPAVSPPAPIPAPDRWLLMKSLQGTWPGWQLDSNRLQISGWTDMGFTASSAADSNLPLGFNL